MSPASEYTVHMYQYLSLRLPLQVSSELNKFNETIKNMVRAACEEYLINKGYVPDPVELDIAGTYIC